MKKMNILKENFSFNGQVMFKKHDLNVDLRLSDHHVIISMNLTTCSAGNIGVNS